MLAWIHLDTASIPNHKNKVQLYHRGDEYSIRLDGYELMNSRQHSSEEILAELACTKIANRPQPKVLIGGLGMGYTLASALTNLPPKTEIIVAELIPAVVKWNKGPLAHLAGSPLDDPRVSVYQEDIKETIQKEKNCFDTIILDVDNGPDGLTRPENDHLYSLAGLKRIKESLKNGGILAVWSASPDHKFSQRLNQAGFKYEEVKVKAHTNSKRKQHTIWLASQT